MNDSVSKIAPALIKAKKAFAPALKDKTNPHFRSKYADLGACLEAVDDALLDNGIAVYQETFDDQTGVTVETVFLHESGESIRTGKLHVPAAKQDPQGYGSALTYARRYSLMAACGIAPEDDDGNAASKTKPKAVSAIPELNHKSVPKEVFDNLSQDVQDDLRAIAMDVIAYAAKGALDDAYDFIESKELDSEWKTGLWALFDSKVRSGLKAVGENRKKAA
jgi:hypothetical protein